jgi:hypothetical protein
MNLEPAEFSMSTHQYHAVMEAITSLDTKLTAALNTGLTALNTALVQLTEAHHRALLEQERRNSQFATLAHAEQLSRRVDSMADSAARREEQIKSLREVLATTTLHHDQQIADIEKRLSQDADHSFLQTSNIVGYLATAIISGLAVTLAFLLTHAAAGVH